MYLLMILYDLWETMLILNTLNTMANYTDRMFKKKMDAIQGAGQFLDIPWKDYLGATHTIKLKETKK